MKWLRTNIFSVLSILAIPLIGWLFMVHVSLAVLADDVEELDAQAIQIVEISEDVAVVKSVVEGLEEDIKDIKTLLLDRLAKGAPK